MTDAPDIRVGDAERSQVLDDLSEHFASGYLDVNEFDRRTQAAVVATHRSQLEALKADLPQAHVPATRSSFAADQELDRLVEKGEKLKAIDAAIGIVTTILFFLGLFVFSWSHFWLVFPAAAAVALGARLILGIDDDEEELFDELSEIQKKERTERLRIAAQKRKELGR
ncbi:DUF1707 domain-containing protein [Corynebacterium breve]|uniref:DUF1707 domain-containing protein n=1 Tax=Corynebacterium breve TaxID=3049799 RepID=A0ABY8VEN7_9CORY|nr:DUF1707 domain-containing protein [Corynebacterium breve]WIM68116.1 DUF1707 domain-containing protein [Corynebacterium breve]